MALVNVIPNCSSNTFGTWSIFICDHKYMLNGNWTNYTEKNIAQWSALYLLKGVPNTLSKNMVVRIC